MTVSDAQILDAKSIDMRTLIGSSLVLKRVTADEFAGPCPACGGEDRLRVRGSGWFCRQCRPIDPEHGWHSPIDWLMWREHLTLPEAVARLTDGRHYTAPVTTRDNPVKTEPREPQPAAWQTEAARQATAAQERLWGPEGEPGQAYLMGRGLEPQTWQRFGLGYDSHWHPRRRGQEPAIVMPWLRGSTVVALRYRFLAGGDPKIVSLKGSRFQGILYGRQGLEDYATLPPQANGRCAEGRSTLVLCEGEINAMSIWQAAHTQRVDVMSVGSESANHLTDGMVAFARRYGQVIVWMDKGEIADIVAGQLPSAARIQSPQGQDANDLLRAGKLAPLLAAMRWRTATEEDARSNVYWSLWDDANSASGIDGETAAGLKRMSLALGRTVDLVELEPGRWVTRRWAEGICHS